MQNNFTESVFQLKQEDLTYFEKGDFENVKFWNALGGAPNFREARVLDVGCGHGSLCIDVAMRGAKYVMGIDTDKDRIEFAKMNVLSNFAHLKNNVNFKHGDMNVLRSNDSFNFIISKAAFEHMLEPEITLAKMRDHLKRGGRILIGFAGLWNSPTGGHGRILRYFPYPYAHLIFPESVILKRVNKGRTKPITSIYEYGLNKLSFAEYKDLFFGAGMELVYFDVNKGDSMITKLLRILRKFPLLMEYCTTNLYCILEKKGDLCLAKKA